MAESNNAAPAAGVGFLTLLGLLFIGLKLGGLIDWSWWLVLLPLYGPPALIVLFGLLLVFFALLLGLLSAFLGKQGG